MTLYTIEATLLCLWVYSVLVSLLHLLMIDMCHGFCMLLAQPASGILHSAVDLVCHCLGVESLLLSCHEQSFGVCSDVVFIEPLICAGHVCNFWHTVVPGAMQRLFIPGCSFIWLFLGSYEPLAFFHQWATFRFSCWHKTWGSAFLGTQHFLCSTDLFLSPSCWRVV